MPVSIPNARAVRAETVPRTLFVPEMALAIVTAYAIAIDLDDVVTHRWGTSFLKSLAAYAALFIAR